MKSWLLRWGALAGGLWLVIQLSKLVPDGGGPDGDGDADDQIIGYASGHAVYGHGAGFEGLLSVLGKVGAVLGTLLVLMIISLVCVAFGRWQDRRSGDIPDGSAGGSGDRALDHDQEQEQVRSWPGSR